MQIKIDKHKIIIFSLISLIFITLFYNVINITNKISEENNLYEKINSISKEITDIEKKGKENDNWKNIEVSYYLNNIIAYSIVEKIKNIKIKAINTQFNKTTCLEISFDRIEKEKLVKMISDLSLLGFISQAENGKIILNVFPFSLEDAKKEINK